jgi:hypothetical protein
MDDAIMDYYKKVLSEKAPSQAIAKGTMITYVTEETATDDQPYSIGTADTKERPYTDGVA